MWQDNQLRLFSRNKELAHDGLGWVSKFAIDVDLESKLKKFGHNIVLQGELIGPKIQNNPYGLQKHTVKFFNLFLLPKIINPDFLDLKSTITDMGLDFVPIIDSDYTLPESRSKIIDLANGPSLLHSFVPREGLVCRTCKGPYFSFKVISNAWLLK